MLDYVYHYLNIISIGVKMAHEELAKLQTKFFTEVPQEQLNKKITMPIEAKLKDLTLNADQIVADAHHFEMSGINWIERHTSILQGVAALKSADEHYTFATQENAKAEMIWSENKDALYKWRRESMARLGYLSKHKNDLELARRLDDISDGDRHQDAIMDVMKTINLAEKHFNELSKHSLTSERLIEAKDILSKIRKVYPQVMGEDQSSHKAKELRDRAFWYLCKLERELKDIELPHVFKNNHAKQREYESHYRRGISI